ncbi:hypothetical protein Despr_3138 [Desulfobulbus propionicus DSM 2032]|jgi:hypothetical protein|uniref:Uncharacterized protein n=1 Tax=Desulfobulbus propionicus (strain ATCC 33891 / DSM 2032 / VKM B-1956 / 1pr3) TaxID=577650 RepID=A0A7U3YPY7_DESPD|nr:hypothetical protein [Desulfobulbus propionicus]ADW19268.1 hypothetical protein Despr_3138 [Desulfobulbus propionicus DSM 2032]
MASKTAATDLSYEQLLEMISAFQWMPELKRLRFALDQDRDNGPGNPIYGCLHHLAPGIERMERRGSLTCHEIHLFLIELAQRYELVQQIDAKSLVTEVNRLVQTLSVDLVMLGVGNAYVTGFVLLLRSRAPIEWNRFCDYVERQEWKVNLSTVGAQSPAPSETIINAEDDVSIEPTVTAPSLRGLARAFDNPEFAAYADSVLNGCRSHNQTEEDQEGIAENKLNLRAETGTGKSYQWRFKKFGLR